jgi:hypothetical protein
LKILAHKEKMTRAIVQLGLTWRWEVFKKMQPLAFPAKNKPKGVSFERFPTAAVIQM